MAAAANASQSKNLYTLIGYGDGYLITCADPNACDFYEQKYLTIAKDETMERQAFWNATLYGWFVRGRDVVYAKAFVDYLNQQQETTAEEKEVANALVTMGDLDDEADVELSEDEDLFTLSTYGRAYLIECHDPSQCAFYGNKYIALSDTEEPGVAFWNDRLSGWIVRPEDRDEAEYFVHQANHPKNLRRRPATPILTTPPRPTRATPPVAPVRKSRTFPMGESQRLTRSVARRLFESEQQQQATMESSDDDGLEPDYDSSSDYVPSEDEDESDDEDMNEHVYLPYEGMTLRPNNRSGGFYMTCSNAHHLQGRPYLGHPAAHCLRPNCWSVASGTEQQFLEGGAVFA
jgi:hypothetical protein